MLVLIFFNQMFMRKSFDSSAIILVKPETVHGEMGCKYEKTKCK